MKKVMMIMLVIGVTMFTVTSCGSGEAAPADGADTTHTEGDGHSH